MHPFSLLVTLPLLLVVQTLEADATSPAPPASVQGDAGDQSSKILTSISHARQLLLACKIYAADHNGGYPETLEELVVESLISEEDFKKIIHCPLLKDPSAAGYEYFGKELSDSSPGSAVLLLGKALVDGKRIVATNDGTVEFKVAPGK